jgi:hypothetical protein
MAQPTNLYDRYDAIGLHEDLTEMIHNITPTDTPALSGAGSTTAKQTLHEWQTDTLAAASGTNAAIEGNEAVLVEPTPTVRAGNYTQISVKIVGVSGTLEATDKAGRDSELAYQMAKNGRELKRDVEASIIGVNNASVAGGSGTARESGSISAWLASNDYGTPGASPANRGTSGVAGASGSTAATDGTVRSFDQAILDGVIQTVWESGGNPTQIHAGAVQKTAISGFDGVGARRTDAAGGTIYATADIYVSNFGTLSVIPNRYIRKTSSVDREVYLLDPEYYKFATLRPWQSFELSKTGDSDRRQMLVEWTLEVCNEAAHGVCADLDS